MVYSEGRKGGFCSTEASLLQQPGNNCRKDGVYTLLVHLPGYTGRLCTGCTSLPGYTGRHIQGGTDSLIHALYGGLGCIYRLLVNNARKSPTTALYRGWALSPVLTKSVKQSPTPYRAVGLELTHLLTKDGVKDRPLYRSNCGRSGSRTY